MRRTGLILATGLAVAALLNVAAERPISGSRLEALMARWGFIDETRLAERAYGGLWTGNVKGQDGFVRESQLALISDAASPYRWCDLGEAFLEAGLKDKGQDCLRRAVEFGPRAPQILMRAANGYFRVGDIDQTLACTRQILAIVPVYDDIIFSMYARMGIGTDRVLTEGLPDGDVRSALAYLNFLSARMNVDDARKAWVWANRLHAVNDPAADQYVRALLRANQFEAAVNAWAAYVGPRDGGNIAFLFNGGFEHEPFGHAFDWNIRNAPGARAVRDSTVAHSGRASLRIQFDGNSNISYNDVAQTTVVKPGNYRLQAYLRTDRITTDEGVAIRIYDRENADRLNVVTPAFVGTSGWRLITRDLVVVRPTRLLAIEVVRAPSSKFDSAISGTAWIDDVQLLRR